MNNKDIFGVLFIINHFKVLECRKRIQKLVCLGKYDPSVNYPFSFDFTKYHYGPYSFDLKEFLEKLILMRVIKETLGGGKYSYELTDEGKLILEKIKIDFEKKDLNKLLILTKRYGEGMGLNSLVKNSKVFFVE